MKDNNAKTRKRTCSTKVLTTVYILKILMARNCSNYILWSSFTKGNF